MYAPWTSQPKPWFDSKSPESLHGLLLKVAGVWDAVDRNYLFRLNFSKEVR
jgi:hypothetical protein